METMEEFSDNDSMDQFKGKIAGNLETSIYIFYIYIGWDLDGENHDLLQVFPSTNPVNDV